MMTCRQLIELLIDYVSDELPPELHAHVEQHLRHCPPCMHYLDSYRLTIRLTRQLPPKPLPPELKDRLYAAVFAAGKEPPAAGLAR